MSKKRDLVVYVDDIIDSANAIKSYIKEMNYDDFCKDRKTFSATIREYIIIGEAVSKIIDILEDKFPEYPWRMIKDLRNLIVHEYFGVDYKILWDLSIKELDEMLLLIKQLKNSL